MKTHRIWLACLAVLGILAFTTSRRAEAQVVTWPIYYPNYGVSVTVGYGYFNPWGTYSPWNGPYIGSYPYGFEFPYYQPRTFGAIAYSPSTGNYGFSHTSYDLASAVDLARSFCGADDCRNVVWASAGCAAISVGHSKENAEQPYIGWSYHYAKSSAFSFAQQACQRGGDGCRTYAWMCTP